MATVKGQGKGGVERFSSRGRTWVGWGKGEVNGDSVYTCLIAGRFQCPQ